MWHMATCFGWWIYDSFGRRILGNARKFSIIGLYSICGGGLVKFLGEAGGLGVVSGGGPVYHDVGLREVVTLMGARG